MNAPVQEQPSRKYIYIFSLSILGLSSEWEGFSEF